MSSQNLHEAVTAAILKFSPLSSLPWLIHGFTLRQHDLDWKGERSSALKALQERHRSLLNAQGIASGSLRLVDQVHGKAVAVLSSAVSHSVSPPQADGLVTAVPGIPIGIHVADCCAIYLVETERRIIGLLHSGKKGTEAHIAREGIRRMEAICGGQRSRMLAVLSPCIHPCCYDLDFVGQIEGQLRDEGVGEIWRHPDCTGCHLDRYYSYRREKGQTGRMLAFLMIQTEF